MNESAALVVDSLGYAAGLTVFVAFALRSIIPLRAVAILSNILFILYALAAHLMPVLLLHALLLPLNLCRLWQILHPKQTAHSPHLIAVVSPASFKHLAYPYLCVNGHWCLKGTMARRARRSGLNGYETARFTVELPPRAGTRGYRKKARVVNRKSVDIDLAQP